MSLQALIFDVDGTLAETEETHRKAFNRAFADAGLEWRWDRRRYGELLAVSGGRERIRQFLAEEDPARASRSDFGGWLFDLHRAKTAVYTKMMAAGEIELRPGVERLIREAHAEGLRLAIATTTSTVNIEALFDATLGREWMNRFDVVAATEQAPTKKPNPSVYFRALEGLRLPAANYLAIEDTRNGVLAATAAGIPVLVTPSVYSEGEDFSGSVAVVSDLGDPDRPCRLLAGNDDELDCVDVARLRSWLAAAV